MPPKGYPLSRVPPIIRFMSKVKKKRNGCWQWTGAVQARKPENAYGMFRIGYKADNTAKTVTAHRFIYEYHRGPVPDGLVLDHLCRNKTCVNPDHLEAVTQAINVERTHF